MPDLIELLIPKVKAQSTDASAQPTFGTISSTGTSTQSATVLLKSDSTSVKVGDKFKVKVEIKTNDITINQYRIVIDFDPTKLQVVDQDTTAAGIQIKGLDTIFLTEDAATDNTVSNVGRIRYTAKTSSGSAFAVNREVVEIEFQAQAVGSTPIKIVEGTTGTQLVRASGVGVNFTKNEVTLQIATATSTGGTGNTNTGNTGNTGTGTTTAPVIPNTALSDDLAGGMVLLVSILCIITGVKLKMEKKEPK